MRTIYESDDHAALREQIARFIENEVRPHGVKWEAAGMVPREVLRQMGALGFFGIRYPESYGGSEQLPIASAILAEECGLSGFGGFSATVLVHTDMASPHLAHAASKQQLDRWFAKVIAGELITAVAVTEPDAGSDVAAIRTRAKRDGDVYVLNGSKMFITNGVHADLYFVAAKTDPEAKGSRAISIFAVEKGTPGFSVGRSLMKHGWLCSDTAELVFDNCRVPAENRLGEENRGFYAIMRNFQNERLVLGAMAVGECRRALEITRQYVTTRKAFGGVLADKQVIRQRLSMLEARTAAARQLVYHAAWLMGHEGGDA
ncbi:MAG: acyl-CoA dehydrogenase family protein, partial [Ferrovibrio sp.]